VPLRERAGAQGASDLAMGLAAGGGGALAGVVVGQLGYDVLGAAAAVLACVITVSAVLIRPNDSNRIRPTPALPGEVESQVG
jgi:predicted MFS family arabinose efflux permease